MQKSLLIYIHTTYFNSISFFIFLYFTVNHLVQKKSTSSLFKKLIYSIKLFPPDPKYILMKNKWPDEILTSKMLNILLEWDGDFFFPNVQIKLHFCSDDAIFFGSLYFKCFGSFCRSPAIGIADCCMESICRNTEIPAVTVCPERDYRIFLNWSSIHLSIKIRSQGQERNSSIKCTWGIYNTQQDCYKQPFKRAYFWNFIIPVVPCLYSSHRIGFCRSRRPETAAPACPLVAAGGAAPAPLLLFVI